jgi:gas vesicle protein
MSGDSNTIEEEVETESLIDLLGGPAEEEDEEIDEEVELDDVPETIEELKAALLSERTIKSKRNKSLRKAKDAQHRTQKENEDLMKRLDAFDDKLNNVNQPNNGAEKLEQEAQEWADRVTDDPAQAIEYANHKQAKFEDKLATFLGGMEQRFTDQIAKLNSDTNPERQEFKAEIQKLKSNPDFADYDDATILSLAKTLKKTTIKRPRGSIAGQRPLQTLDIGKDNSLSGEAAKRMGFEG